MASYANSSFTKIPLALTVLEAFKIGSFCFQSRSRQTIVGFSLLPRLLGCMFYLGKMSIVKLVNVIMACSRMTVSTHVIFCTENGGDRADHVCRGQRFIGAQLTCDVTPRSQMNEKSASTGGQAVAIN